MKSQWKECALGDIVTFQRGYDLPKAKMSGAGYPVIGSTGIIGFHNEYTTEAPAVTIGRSGNVGNPFIFYGRAWCHNTSLFVKEFKDADPVFTYYFLKTLDLGSYAGGSAVPTLNRNHIHNLPVRVPASLETQKRIGAFLKSLDDKAAINAQINENLQQQAQAIFKEWFVNFSPFGYTMPANWRKTLGSIARISTETFSPKKNPKIEVEHYSIPAFDEKRFPVFEIAANIKSNKYRVSKCSVIISKLNPSIKRLWRPYCLSEFPICSTEFIVYEPLNPSYRDFLYSLIDNNSFSEYLCSHTTGSTNSRQRATPSETLDFEIAYPEDSVIQTFCSVVTPLYDLMESNFLQNQSLEQNCKEILPRLMSGELDISGLDP